MRNLWQFYRAKVAAKAAIQPFVRLTRNRFGAIPDQYWRTPYMIGFLASLISHFLLSSWRHPPDNDQLGLAQLNVWQEITGLADDSIGEEICLLSAGNDEEFNEGCRKAHMFILSLSGSLDMASVEVGVNDDSLIEEGFGETHLDDQELRIFRHGGAVSKALWRRDFEIKIFGDCRGW